MKDRPKVNKPHDKLDCFMYASLPVTCGHRMTAACLFPPKCMIALLCQVTNCTADTEKASDDCQDPLSCDSQKHVDRAGH